MRKTLHGTNPGLIKILLLTSFFLLFLTVFTASAQEELKIKPNPESNYHLGPQLLPSFVHSDSTTENSGPLLLETSCPNSNFSTGTWANWTGCYGLFDPATNCQNPGFLTTGSHPLHKMIASPGYEDARTCFGLINVFPGESFVARLGDTMYTSQPGAPSPPIYKEAELKYAVNVTSNSYLFIYRYAIILQSGNHASNIQPDFKVAITDVNGTLLDPTCGYYLVTAQQSGPPAVGWNRCQNDPQGDVYWKPWTTVGMDLTPYYGQTVYLNFKVRGCTYNTHYGYAYISSYCSALAIQIGLCAGSTTATLTAPPGFQTYEWRGPGYFGPVIGSTPSIIIPSPQAGDTYFVNLTAINGCTVNDLNQQIIFTTINSNFTFTPNCAGQASTFTDASTVNQNAVVNWHWDFGDLSPVISGIANPTHVYASPGNYTVNLTSYSTEGCMATSNHTITIPAVPVPALTGPAGSCVNGPALVYTTDPGKLNYVWTIPPGAILVAGGTSTSNTATIDFNTLGPNVVSVSYTIPGTICSAASPTTLTVSVEPQPTPVITGSNLACLGVQGNTYSTQAGKSNYTWVVPPQGTKTAGGGITDNFVTVTWNTVGTFNISVNYTDPVSLCTADAPATFPVTVNTSPTVNPVTTQVLCHNNPTSLIQFSGTIPGTIYNWTNDNTTIGLPAAGSGDISSFTATNITTSTVQAAITVTPSYTNAGVTCTGTPVTFNITVNPIPVAGIVPNQVVCHNAPTTLVQFTADVSGTTYAWTNDNTTIGLAASGSGNIASFNAINSTTAPVNATITVTPSFTNAGPACTGTPTSFTITVNPQPMVYMSEDQVLCHNTQTNLVHFTGDVTGTVYDWTNSNTSVGLAASGTGDIVSFTVTNSNFIPETAIVTVTPSFTYSGATCQGTPSLFTIIANPIPTVNLTPNQVLCHQETTAGVTFSGNVAGTVYNWVNSNTSIGLAASGSGDISSFMVINTGTAPQTATITVTPAFTNLLNTCTGNPSTFTITVNPIPTVNPMASQVLCHNTSTDLVQFSGSVPGTVYNWTNSNTTIGLAAIGTGDISAFTGTNNSNMPIVATIVATPAFTFAGPTCTGTSSSFTVTVNPIPSVDAVTNQVLCHQVSTSTVTFSGNVPGTVYNWVNSNTAIGLAAAGFGNIPAFTAINTGTAPETATITVTPTYTNSAVPCTGSPTSFTITVNPIPTVNAPANQFLCHNVQTNLVQFSGAVPGTAYSWTNSNTSIGLAAGGSGDIPSFTATNTTNSPVTAIITVTPAFTGSGSTCTGLSSIFTITVNPIPTVTSTSNQVRCHLFSTAPVNFTGNVAGTVYSWVNSNTSIGLAASGTGNIASFTATNITGSPVTATITVTPAFTGNNVTCTGTSANFTITVNPLPVPTISGPASVCLNIPAAYTTEDFQSGYIWNIVSGGTIASGQSTRQVNVVWNTLGTHTITVNYSDPQGCTSVLPTPLQVVVNSLPTPVITGAATVCAGDTKTYQTQGGALSYTWGLPSSGITIISGGDISDDNVKVQWNTAGLYNISVNYVIGTGCTAPAPTNYGVVVNALPTPQITGPAPVCALSAHNYVISPIVAGHFYSWSVTGGTIQSGQNANTCQVFWGNSSPGSLGMTETINYPGLSCQAAATAFPVVLDPWPGAAGMITGQNSVCKTSSYTYSIPAILNATSCQWIYSGTGITITNNGSSAISITFGTTATSGALTVKGVNNCGNGPVSLPLNIAVHNLPEVSFTPCFDLFTSTGAKKIILRGGTPWLSGQGVYSGNRVALNTLTGFYEFDPMGATAGSYSIIYTFTNTFGCLASSATVSVTVQNTPFGCGGDLTDIRDGKKYKTAILGGRCWMTENLSYGSILASPGPIQTDNCMPEKYCAPTDAGCTLFGGKYQWDELMDYAQTAGTKGICPPEWHVPTETEWQSLIDNLVIGIGSPDANALSGSTLKDVLLFGGFHALMGGLNYNDYQWSFYAGAVTGSMYWTSSSSVTTRAISRGLNFYSPSISRYSSSRGNAFSLRCIKD